MEDKLPRFSIFKVSKMKRVITDSQDGYISEDFYFSTKELASKFSNQYMYVNNITIKVEEIKVNETSVNNG